MNGTKLLTAAMAALVLVGGLAAVGAATSADVSNANTADDRAGAVGPADGLPEQVPDHVSETHDTVGSFLDGSIDSLGESLSDLRPDDGAAASSGGENGSDGPTRND